MTSTAAAPWASTSSTDDCRDGWKLQYRRLRRWRGGAVPGGVCDCAGCGGVVTSGSGSDAPPWFDPPEFSMLAWGRVVGCAVVRSTWRWLVASVVVQQCLVYITRTDGRQMSFMS